MRIKSYLRLHNNGEALNKKFIYLSIGMAFLSFIEVNFHQYIINYNILKLFIYLPALILMIFMYVLLYKQAIIKIKKIYILFINLKNLPLILIFSLMLNKVISYNLDKIEFTIFESMFEVFLLKELISLLVLIYFYLIIEAIFSVNINIKLKKSTHDISKYINVFVFQTFMFILISSITIFLYYFIAKLLL
ncbi:hypothetical protein ACOJTA_11050 [Malaciobacter sp. WC5094]